MVASYCTVLVFDAYLDCLSRSAGDQSRGNDCHADLDSRRSELVVPERVDHLLHDLLNYDVHRLFPQTKEILR